MATSRAHARRGAVRSARASVRPNLEGLEPRRLMATFQVTTTADSGTGSLRQAILDADAAPSTTDVISFAITPGSGTQTISPATPLPAITTPMTIDGTTQPGYLGNPLIVINGANAGSTATGLTITGGGTTVRGIVIGGFKGAGITISGAGKNTLVQDFIGVNAVGLIGNSNFGGGVLINDSPSNTIGGTTSTTEVIVSGNAGAGIDIVGAGSTGNEIIGSLIGTDASGSATIGNSGPGIEIDGAAGNTIGSTVTGGRNVIAGNGQDGILLSNGASGNLIEGNFIGTNAAGTAALPNNLAGIEINASPSNTIGGTTSGALNVVSGNAGVGISIDASASTGNTLLANLIGVNDAGTAALANTSDGIRLTGAVANTIGGVGAGDGNVISANTGNGISLLASTTGTVIQGNEIGTDASGNLALGNKLEGIFVQASSTNTIGATVTAVGTSAGATNQIENNAEDGVYINSGTGDTIRQNATSANTGLAIHLATGANANLLAPTVSGASTAAGSTTITGSYSGTSGSTYTLDFYTNTVSYPSGIGQGKVYIGTTTVTPGSTGVATYSFSPANPVGVGGVISATATSTAGNTSQFSNQIAANPPTVDLAITGTNSANPVGVGQTLTDTFVVTNTGTTSATDVMVADTIPSGVSLVMTTSTAGVITLNGGTFSVNLGTIASGGTATVSLSYIPLVAQTIQDKAVVATSDQSDANTNNNAATVTTVVQPAAYLYLTDSTSPSTAAVGGLVAYYVTVVNMGPSTAAGVTITDTIPSGGTIVSTSATQGSAPSRNGTVVASLGSIPNKGSETLTIVVKPTVVGTLTDSAAVSSSTVIQYQTNVTASASATITQSVTPVTPPTSGDGPTVVGVARSGIENQPTKYAIGFDTALFPAQAQSLANYAIVDLGTNGKQNKSIAISSAVYNASNNSVTLSPRTKINLHDELRLTVNGLAPDGVTGSNGLLLDGEGTGTPGSSYSVTFKGFGPDSTVSTSSIHPSGPKSKTKIRG